MRLAHSVLFQGMPMADLEPLLQVGQVLSAADGEAMTKEGEGFTGGLYIVLTGGVEVLKGGALVPHIGRGSFFGEISLLGLTSGPTATIRGKGPTRLFLLTRQKIEDWFTGRPRAEAVFFRRLSVELAKRLFSTTDRLAKN